MIARLGWQYKPVTTEVIGFKIQIQISRVPLSDEELEGGEQNHPSVSLLCLLAC